MMQSGVWRNLCLHVWVQEFEKGPHIRDRQLQRCLSGFQPFPLQNSQQQQHVITCRAKLQSKLALQDPPNGPPPKKNDVTGSLHMTCFAFYITHKDPVNLPNISRKYCTKNDSTNALVVTASNSPSVKLPDLKFAIQIFEEENIWATYG